MRRALLYVLSPAIIASVGDERLGRILIGVPVSGPRRVRWLGFGGLVAPQLVLDVDVRSEASAASAP